MSTSGTCGRSWRRPGSRGCCTPCAASATRCGPERMSIRARITLYGLAVVLTVLTCFSAAVWGLVVVGLPGGQDRRLQDRADEAVRSVQQAPADQFATSRPLAPVRPATDDDLFVVVLDGSGAVLSTTGGVPPSTPAALLDGASRSGT